MPKPAQARPKTSKVMSATKKRRSLSKENDDKVLVLEKNNIDIKNKNNELMEKIKVMSTQLVKIQRDMQVVKKLENETMDPTVVKQVESLSTLEKENVDLKDKLTKLSKVIKALQTGTYSQKKGKKVIKPAPKLTQTAKPTDFKDKLIDQLKLRLEDTETQLQRVHTNKPEKQPLDNFKISEHKSEMQDTNYKAKEQIFERTKSMLDDALNEIKDKNVEIERLKAKLSTATFSAEQDKDIARDYRLLKDQKEDLERKYIDLSETPFIKNPNGQVMANRVKDLESENIQLKGKYEEMKDDLIKKEIERGKFEDKYNTVEQEKTQLREENLRLRSKYEGNGINMTDVQQLLRENDPTKFRETMEKMNLNGELPKWANLDFLEKNHQIDMNSTHDLNSELERIKLEKAQLASELDKAQTQLKMKEDEMKEQMALSNAKIKDYQERLKDAQLQNKQFASTYNKSPSRFDVIKGITEENNEPALSEISAESMVEAGQNKVDILLERIELNKDAMVSLKMINGTEVPFTNVIITFATHDSLRTEFFSDFIQDHFYQVQFNMKMDEKFVDLLRDYPLKLEIYQAKNNVTSKIAKGKLSMSSLIGYQAFKVQESQVMLISTENNEVSIGFAKVKYRLRHPIPKI